VLLRGADQRADRGAEPAIALRSRQPGKFERDRDRILERVAVRGYDPRGEVPVVQVDREDAMLP
jgi:hypothetical protein